jgi:ribosomal protein S14
MEVVKCEFCGSRKGFMIGDQKDGTFTLYLCRVCKKENYRAEYD